MKVASVYPVLSHLVNNQQHKVLAFFSSDLIFESCIILPSVVKTIKIQDTFSLKVHFLCFAVLRFYLISPLNFGLKLCSD